MRSGGEFDLRQPDCTPERQTGTVGKPYTRLALVVYKLSKGLISQQSHNPARIMRQKAVFALATAFSYLKIVDVTYKIQHSVYKEGGR